MRVSVNHGFTLIELVAVIIIVGILAAFTIPQFVGVSAVNARGVYDNLTAALRYAQKTAIASNCPVRVTIQSNGYSLKHRGDPCGSGSFKKPVYRPGGGEFTADDLGGISLSPAATITFKATGTTTAANDITINVIGGGQTRSLTVIADTGYVATQ